MKKFLTGLTMVMSLGLPYRAGADSSAVNGLLLGAGSGALIGQAIGRDTKGTLVGTAIGSVLGYAIGNEMDKEGVYRPLSRPAGHYPQPRMVVVRPESLDLCRETEILATIDGRAETIYGISCWQDGDWIMVADQPPAPSYITRTVIIRERNHHRHGHRHQKPRHWGWDDHDHDRGNHRRRVNYRAER